MQCAAPSTSLNQRESDPPTRATKNPALPNDLAHPNTTKIRLGSTISAHLELHKDMIGLCINKAAQIDTNCYIPGFSSVESPHLAVETESPPSHLPIHINAVLQPLWHRFNTLVDKVLTNLVLSFLGQLNRVSLILVREFLNVLFWWLPAVLNRSKI
jgi:hypothetical protein